MTRVYLDTSIYNRPFDDQTQPKVFLETQAVILILQMVEAKLIELVSSSVLEYENSRNPFIVNQQSAPSLRDATRTGKSKVKSQKSKIYQAHK